MRVLIAIVFLSQVARTKGVRCYRCFEATDPAHCGQTALCGESEICYTRLFKDHNGEHRFHLGCEEQTTCTLLKTAAIIGKREVENEPSDSTGRCFDCCSDDECNSKLCLNTAKLLYISQVTTSATLVTTTPTTSTTTPTTSTTTSTTSTTTMTTSTTTLTTSTTATTTTTTTLATTTSKPVPLHNSNNPCARKRDDSVPLELGLATGSRTTRARPGFHDTGSIEWRDCSVGGHWLHITSLDISPNPIRLPGCMTVSFDGTISHHISSNVLTADILVEKELLGRYTRWFCNKDENIGTCHYTDLCHFLREMNSIIFNGDSCPVQFVANGLPCTCPFNLDRLHLSASQFQLPHISDEWKIILAGENNYHVKLTMNDERTGQLRGCLELYLTLAV